MEPNIEENLEARLRALRRPRKFPHTELEPEILVQQPPRIANIEDLYGSVPSIASRSQFGLPPSINDDNIYEEVIVQQPKT
jgi:hypothetical protein